MSSSIPINIPSTNTISPTPKQQTSSSLSSLSYKNVLFHELQITINSAKLASKETQPIKHPDIYVELLVDDSPVHKTDCLKSTYSPKWDFQFPVLITPYSKLTFKVYQKVTNLTKDILLGDNSINLYDTLKRLNGKIDNLSMPLILDRIKQANCNQEQQTTSLSLDSNDQANNDELLIDNNKPNYLFIKLTGLEIDMIQYPPKSRSVSPNVSCVIDGQAIDKNSSSKKNKSNHEKHSTRSLPRLFRGSNSKHHQQQQQSNNSTTNSPSPNLNQSENNNTSNSTTTLSSSADNQQIENLINGFQTTLPRWSLNDPNTNNSNSNSTNLNNNSPYPRQPTTMSQNATTTTNLQNSPTPPPPPPITTTTAPTTTGGNNQFSSLQTGNSPTAFSITNNSNQVQSATITTTEFQEELPAGWESRFDCFGRKYYVDHNTKSTTWELPIQMEALPVGWEIRRDVCVLINLLFKLIYFIIILFCFFLTSLVDVFTMLIIIRERLAGKDQQPKHYHAINIGNVNNLK